LHPVWILETAKDICPNRLQTLYEVALIHINDMYDYEIAALLLWWCNINDAVYNFFK